MRGLQVVHDEKRLGTTELYVPSERHPSHAAAIRRTSMAYGKSRAKTYVASGDEFIPGSLTESHVDEHIDENGEDDERSQQYGATRGHVRGVEDRVRLSRQAAAERGSVTGRNRARTLSLVLHSGDNSLSPLVLA